MAIQLETKVIIGRGNVSSLTCTNPEATAPTTTSGGSTTSDADTICDMDPIALASYTTMRGGDTDYEENASLDFSEDK